ncbi:MAG: hypothetical protein ICV55_12840 [Coleofasciculus sp. C3-bin4]|nr:hypothetical protein [Coleofasciculus sp. C3-bin4]
MIDFCNRSISDVPRSLTLHKLTRTRGASAYINQVADCWAIETLVGVAIVATDSDSNRMPRNSANETVLPLHGV